MASKVRSYCLVEPSIPLLEAARAAWKSRSVESNFFALDLTKHNIKDKLEDKTFDAVVCFDRLGPAFRDNQKALNLIHNAAAVLGDGGLFFGCRCLVYCM
jgi:hypothetical protein